MGLTVMGLDTSTKTGLAVIEWADTGRLQLHETALLKAPKKIVDIERCSNLVGQMLERIEKYQPDIAIIEGYGFGNQHTLVTLVEIGTVFRYFLKQIELPYIVVPPTSLKKFVTGSGNAKKDHMLMEVYKRWGFEAKTNDEADAYGLAMLGGALYGQVEMPKVNMTALDPIRRQGLPPLSLK